MTTRDPPDVDLAMIRRETVLRIARRVILTSLVSVAIYAGFERWIALTPMPGLTPEVSSTALDRHGNLLRAWQVEDGIWRLPATQAETDAGYLAQLIAYEDGRFFDHAGVDLLAIARSAGQAIWYRRFVSGASTITMQVARLLRRETTKSLDGKIAQMRLAWALERRLSKREILNLYLTLAPFGGNLEGVRAASLAWFGKEPRRLIPAEAALLVALPQSPEARRPDRFPSIAFAARDRVLNRSMIKSVLTRESADAARNEPIPRKRKSFPKHAPHLTDQERFTGEAVALTVDLDLQSALERVVADHVETLPPLTSAALVVADHTTGEILASIGSPGLHDMARSGFVDMTRAVRSPGSALKPLIYGMAFEAGAAHPESVIDDSPASFGQYRPTNFDGQYRGPVSVRTALQLSLNIPAVTLLDAVGPASFLARMRRIGANPILPPQSVPGLAIGLGGVGMTLRILVASYAAIANEGMALPLIHRADTGHSARRFLSRRAAWYVADVLAGTPAPLDASNGQIAFKTGTTYGYRDAWAVGFDGRHVVGVWTGRPDAAPVAGMTGIRSAAPVLFRTFSVIGGERAAFPAPPREALIVSSHELPEPLRQVRATGSRQPEQQPDIVFPPNNARVQITSGEYIALKLRSGSPPFTWFVNGEPFATRELERDLAWRPQGPGHFVISVVDRYGRSDRSIFIME